MLDNPELRLLLPTDFSDASARAAGAVAQLAGTCPVRLTVAHVAPAREAIWPTRRRLETFLADHASSYRHSGVLIRGADPVKSVAELCNSDRFDAVMVPSSRRGARLFGSSFRERLLRRTRLPLWTIGAGTSAFAFERPIRRVAGLVDFDDAPEAMVRAVSSFASRVGARLHLLAVIPPIDDGVLAAVAGSAAPLDVRVAMGRLRELAECYDIRADVDVAVGRSGPHVPHLASTSRADLLFISREHASLGPFGFRIPPGLERLPCPVVCFDPASTPDVGRAAQYLPEAVHACGRLDADCAVLT